MIPEYHLMGKGKRTRKQRKNFDVNLLPPRSAKGRYRKGEGFNKGPHVHRTPIMGDALMTTEAAVWLRRR